jgi:hypothetical protein
MHPAVSRDGQWVAFNARQDVDRNQSSSNNCNKEMEGNNRRVFIAFLGDDLERYFASNSSYSVLRYY